MNGDDFRSYLDFRLKGLRSDGANARQRELHDMFRKCFDVIQFPRVTAVCSALLHVLETQQLKTLSHDAGMAKLNLLVAGLAAQAFF